jgi:lysophospholipase L1-like esterase
MVVWGCVGLLWLATVWFGLELYVLLSIKWEYNHNPYILSARGVRTYPHELDAPAANPLPDIVPDTAVTWTSFRSLGVTGAWAAPVGTETDAQTETRRQAFPGLSESDRDYFATLHSELVCVFDAHGNLLGRYGNWLPSYSGELAKLFKRAQSFGNSDFRELHPDEVWGMLRFYFIKGPDNASYGFLNFEKMLLERTAFNLPPDTPWEIPFFRYKPNLHDARSAMGEPHFNTNSLGFRGGELAVPKPANTFRIMCMGGSTTEEGSDNVNYPKCLEKELRDAFPGRNIEVVNCGVCGIKTSGLLLRLAEYLKLQPDLIVLYEGVNDITHDLMDFWEYQKSFPSKLLTYVPSLRYEMSRLLFPSRARIAADLENLTVKNLRAIQRAAAERGIRVAICGLACPDVALMGARERAYLDYNSRTAWYCHYLSVDVYCQIVEILRERLKEFCAQEGVLYIPVNEGIPGTLYYFTDFCHLWPWGIERKAHVIAEGLREYIRPALQ